MNNIVLATSQQLWRQSSHMLDSYCLILLFIYQCPFINRINFIHLPNGMIDASATLNPFTPLKQSSKLNSTNSHNKKLKNLNCKIHWTLLKFKAIFNEISIGFLPDFELGIDNSIITSAHLTCANRMPSIKTLAANEVFDVFIRSTLFARCMFTAAYASQRILCCYLANLLYSLHYSFYIFRCVQSIRINQWMIMWIRWSQFHTSCSQLNHSFHQFQWKLVKQRIKSIWFRKYFNWNPEIFSIDFEIKMRIIRKWSKCNVHNSMNHLIDFNNNVSSTSACWLVEYGR